MRVKVNREFDLFVVFILNDHAFTQSVDELK
jgi:hypothetical protein